MEEPKYGTQPKRNAGAAGSSRAERLRGISLRQQTCCRRVAAQVRPALLKSQGVR